MRTKSRFRYLTLTELRIERCLAVIVGMFIGYWVTHFYLDPDEQQQSLFRIEHMIKACVPNSPDQFTTMRLVQRGMRHELLCEKQPVVMEHPLQPSAAVRRAI
ncbi:hypothetical protein [Methylobacillus flagellatus]|uniref:Uncharacterized protein n=1 Tax=Methylobacillus flagellatus (strain ATCC 51484 / DSM 6875 / VKM B-1610 / KT) TaxID=265072 RepID=Q1GXQ5_METFK|nr:hypothetical protein [Methylobacillus flagellatus]ABE50982.1 hypothetical protein Mfla_2719 [Methylobacillus flagellatus KT]